jgi:hypothetical protein
MRLDKEKLIFLAVWSICAGGGAYPQNAIDKLQPLVEDVCSEAFRRRAGRTGQMGKWDASRGRAP